MKKRYITPDFEMVKLIINNQLLAISDSNQTGEGDVHDEPIIIGDDL